MDGPLAASRETLINGGDATVCGLENVFLVKAASSQRQAGADGLVSSGELLTRQTVCARQFLPAMVGGGT